MGLLTLLVFPIPTFVILPWIEGVSFWEILDFENVRLSWILAGICFGIAYALFALLCMSARVFRNMPTRIEQIVRNMRLNIWECIFLSLCAGIGEELLFRSGMQFYFGPWITSVVFVAIHGYLNPMNWRVSLYGLIVLPFILGISFALPVYGLWFCIAAHSAYDLVLFLAMTYESED